MIRVAIVEDQTMLRESLAAAIESEQDMHVALSLEDAADLVGLLETNPVDLALLDVCTKNNSSGIVAAGQVKERYPQVKTVIMTGMPDVTFVRKARDAKADSFIYKNVSTKEFLSILRSTMEGYSTFPAAKACTAPELELLTSQEIEILQLVCEAKNRKQIASELYMSEGSVKRHISEMLAKTGYDSILKLAVRATSCGAITPNVER